ncbi:MAG: ester cyclase [Myxococcales bacterium]|nr:ester cyclase [Myxococcales bacterium]MBK7191138.1 ester cyclase [Myxococcales bacterium]
MNRSDAVATVSRFYQQALTVSPGGDSTAVLTALLADDFQSINSQEVKPKAALIKQIEFFWKLVPDLTWTPQQFVVEGDHVVVRSVATGTPRGNFMGLEVNGSRSFRIDTIDIHALAGGRIQRVHHLEDWATAMRQLRG